MHVTMRRLKLGMVTVLLSGAASTLDAQIPAIPRAQLPILSVKPVVFVTDDSVDRIRLNSLADSSTHFPMLRSASTLSAGLTGGYWRPKLSVVSPRVLFVTNSAIPYTRNDGPLWAGRGSSVSAASGLRVQFGPLRAIIVPEVLRSENRDWVLRDTVRFYAPPIPKDRQGGGFVFPWYLPPLSIDQPLRMGADKISRIDAGQSSVFIYAGPVAFGAATENEWWGPGVRNAIVLSNNAGGFPHIALRTSEPIRTRFGTFDARLIAGGISESGFFDTTSTNNLQAISLAGLSYSPPRNPALSLGFARAVYGTVNEWSSIPGRLLRSFSNPGRPNNRPLSDSSEYPGGEDQVYSLFARWVSPPDGFESYVEWSRTELPASLRDIFLAPNHTQGYTLGLQWRKPAPLNARTFRLQAEVTTLEQSATFRDRGIGSYYTSRKVIQGYTHHGQVIGASIGPGASAQWLAADYLADSWYAGPFVGRTRWNEDMHSVYGWPSYIGYCNHDVSVYTGVRSGWRSKYLSATAEMTFGNRINAWFQEQSGCPNGPSRLDIRNRTLSVTLTSGSF
ncbi:MAG: hypothetical protein H0W69_01525 [Gemmatimonadaceae bacterium]|nr:hypothetical protein [Gemmatimonadaceae bacterium]